MEEKIINIKISSGTNGKTDELIILDNDTNLKEIDVSSNTITVASIVEESCNGTLSKKCKTVCGDFYGERHLEPSLIKVNCSYGSEFFSVSIMLDRFNTATDNKFSLWGLASDNYNMLLKDVVLKPNKNKKRADLNLCILSFFFTLGGFHYKNTTNDKGIQQSVETIKKN